MSYYSKPLSADVGSIQIFCRIRLTENLRWINKWILIEIINTNRNKEKVMRSLFLASTSWLENVCCLAKEIINAKIASKWKMLMFTTKWKMLMFTTIFSYQRHMSRWQGAHAERRKYFTRDLLSLCCHLGVHCQQNLRIICQYGGVDGRKI